MRLRAFFVAFAILAGPAPAATGAGPGADVFRTILASIQTQYVEERDTNVLLKAAIDGLLAAHPSKRASDVARQRLATPADGVDRQAAVFDAVLAAAKQDYAGRLDAAVVFEAAITPMLALLDPLTTYYSPGALDQMRSQTAGKFGGVGLELTIVQGEVKVVAALEGTPAEAAGLRPGDAIVEINGKPVRGLDLAAVVAQIRGEIGKPVFLTIAREGDQLPLQVRLVRAQIVPRQVRQRVEGDIGYIRISTFSDTTSEGIKAAIGAIRQEIGEGKVRGYVLDLRSNTGGALDQVIAAADLFLEAGDIVSTHGRTPESDQSFVATPGDLAEGVAMAVLVDKGTSSGAEIVAGALKDNGRAKIVGARTFGKGSVQTLIQLGENGALRLTTSRFYTPSGRNLEGRGIDPDLAVDGPATAPGEGEADIVLQAALAYLRGEPRPAATP